MLPSILYHRKLVNLHIYRAMIIFNPFLQHNTALALILEYSNTQDYRLIYNKSIVFVPKIFVTLHQLFHERGG